MDRLRFSSVYRIQMSEQSSFAKVQELLSYLKELGVEGIYFSPYFASYNCHGYDIVEATKLNPNLGSEEEFHALVKKMHQESFAHVIDVVPNHMGMLGNPWWQDLLKFGPASSYASFFDVNWHSEKKELHNKVLLPLLQEGYQQVLMQHKIQLCRIANDYFFCYETHHLPLTPSTFPEESDVELINQFPERMHALLERQHYRLSYWAVATDEINYRRFFNINDLVALRIEDPVVLESHHKLIFSLMQKGSIDAVRIDHPDGLYDPAAYFKELKARKNLPLIVEKILGAEEKLPSSWHVEGSVGYEYLNALNGLFVDPKQEGRLNEIYSQFLKNEMNFEEILYQSKKIFTNRSMVHEIETLALYLDEITENEIEYREFTRFEFTEALQEMIASLPVYRTYITPKGRPCPEDCHIIKAAITAARKKAPWLDVSLFDFLEKLFLCELPKEAYRTFILRWQQLTGPIMAKGLEDTAFYIFNRLLSLNEVGGNPAHFGTSIARFHQLQKEKRDHWPLGFFPTSTHDTKRSEDVRMRIHLLSELPEEWEEHLQQWNGEGRNDLYYLYQTLLGIWPRGEMNHEEKAIFIEKRLWPLVLKSLREAKVKTSWQQPNISYENRFHETLSSLLYNEQFLQSFFPFQKKIDYFGALNTLSAQVLRCGSCAIIDIYQGSEILQYSLMDPDNRREVDYDRLQKMIKEIKYEKALALYQEERFEALKLWLLRTMLHERRRRPDFFLSASYIPIIFEDDSWIGYERDKGNQKLLVIAKRFYATSKTTMKELHLQKKYPGFSSLFTGESIEIPSTLPFQWYVNE